MITAPIKFGAVILFGNFGSFGESSYLCIVRTSGTIIKPVYKQNEEDGSH